MMPDQPYGMNGDQFAGFDVADADDDEEQHRDELDRHHRRVEPRALAHADDQQHHDREHDQHRRQVDERAAPAGVPARPTSRPADAMPKPARIRWK